VGLRESALEAMVHLHSTSEPQLHQLVSDPAAADLIVFVGLDAFDFSDIVRSALPRRYPEKCFAYSDADGFVPLLPGLYSNAEQSRGVHLRRTAGCAFIDGLNPAIEQLTVPKRYLFTFAGGSTSILRKRLFRLHWSRPDVLVEDTSNYHHWNSSQEGRDERQRVYAENMASSRFVLCPRGASAGSQRLFEVMQMGIAPVLISNRYDLPPGPDWDRFLIRIPEKDIERLPEILEAHAGEYAERGDAARQAWEQWFAPNVAFNVFIATYEEIRRHRRVPERLIHLTWGFMRLRYWSARKIRGGIRGAVLWTFRKLRLKFVYQLNR
jgi:hypothetical protein